MAFIPHTAADVAEMLARIGVKSIDELFEEIPASLRVRSLAGIPAAMNEQQVGRLMSERARAASSTAPTRPIRRRRARARCS